MSSPIQPSGISIASTTRRCASASKRSAITTSTGSRIRRPAARARSSTRPASSTPSSSTSESPVAIPSARKKLKHIAPPIRISSAVSRKRSMTPILSLTLAPPRITTKGGVGIVADGRQLDDLALEQQAGVGRQQVRHPLGRRVGAVRGAEGVVDVELGELGELGRELGVVLLLAGLEAAVLEHEHVARRRAPRRRCARRRRRHRARARRRLRAAPRAAPPPAPSRARARGPSAARGAKRARAGGPGRAAARSSAARRGSGCRRRPPRRRAGR